MNFSGQNFLSLPEVDSLSFNVPLSINSMYGTGCFGFSGSGDGGQEKILNFKFESGKVKDFNDNTVYSYYPNLEINFSGNISSGRNVYYINDQLFSLSGTQDYFKFKRFFFDSEFNFDSNPNLSVPEPTITFSNPQFFDISGLYTGSIEKNYEYEIFSANLQGGNAKLFSITGTDLNAGNKTGSFTISTGEFYSGLQPTTHYEMFLNFNSNIGDITKVLTFTGINYSEGDIKVSSLNKTERKIDFTRHGEPIDVRSNKYLLSYVLSSSGIPQQKPIGVELSYFAGDTGIFSGFSGDVNISYGGSGYSSGNNPIIATGAGGSGFVGDLLSDRNFLGTFYYVSGESGINLINSGSGYSGTGPTGEHLFNIKGTHLSTQSQSGLSGLSGFFSEGYGSTSEEIINNTASGWPIVDSYTCNTKKVYQVTGFYMFNSGKYLNEIPTLTFSGTSHGDCTQLQTATATVAISGSGDFSQGSGSITGINVFNIGENYTGTDSLDQLPQLTYSGIGTGAAIEPVMFSYNKKFFETWNLSTGISPLELTSFSGLNYSGTDNVSETKFSDSSFGGGSNLLPSNRTSLFVQVDYVPYYDTGQVVAKLRVTGDNFDIVEYITGQK